MNKRITVRARGMKVMWGPVGWRRHAAAVVLAAGAAAAHAAPAVPLALDIDGEVHVTNNTAHTSYHFSEAQLLKLPTHAISTSTTWTPRSTFTGPLLSDVLKAVGAYGFNVRDGRVHAIRAKSVLLCTGGTAGLYRPSNPGMAAHRMWYSPFNTGAGLAMGFALGERLSPPANPPAGQPNTLSPRNRETPEDA